MVTPHPSVWRRVENPEQVESDVRKEKFGRILTDHRWRCLAHNRFDCWNEGLGWVLGGLCRVAARRLGLDSGVGWIAPAEKACSGLSKGDVDVVLATSSPPSAFRLAKKLSERLGCPYVMDYRDPWTQNPHGARSARRSRMKEEARLLAGSAAVTIVSRSWGEILKAQYGLDGKLHVITNGYDPEDLEEVRPTVFGQFAIVYAGVFYPPKRVITPVMEALERLKDSSAPSRDYRFHYYGPHGDHVSEAARRHGVSDRVVLHGEVSREAALAGVKGAGVSVVITSVSENGTAGEQGIVTGKIFEPVGLNVPALLISPPGSDAETVVRTAGLGEAFRAADVDGMARFLKNLMAGFEIGRGNRSEYSWANIARKLDRILQDVLSEQRVGINDRVQVG